MPAHRSSCHQRGTAAVEFALVIFVLFLIGAGLVEFGRAFWYYDAISKGTRDAARYLSTVPLPSLNSESTTARQIVVRAASESGVPGFANANVSVACQPVACSSAALPSDIARVVVSANYPMDVGALFPFIVPDGPSGGSYSVALTPHTSMPYMW